MSTPTGPEEHEQDLRAQAFGLALLLAGLPFLAASLAFPGITGAVGMVVSTALHQWFGRAAWLLPWLLLGGSLRLVAPHRVRALWMGWPVLLLWLDLMLLAQRMGGQGGWVGYVMDTILVQGLGPAGAWIGGAAGLAGSLMLVCRVTPGDAARWLGAALRWAARLGLRVLRATWKGLAALHPGPWTEEPSQEAEVSVPETGTVSFETSRETVPVLSSSGEAEVEQEEPVEGISPDWPGPEEPEPRLLEVSHEDSEPDQALAVSEDPAAGPPARLDPLPSSETLREEVPSTVKELPAVSPAIPPAVPARPPAERAPEPAGKAKAPPILRGVLEDPNGQLRLFPGPAPAPAAAYKLPPLALLDAAPPGKRRAEEDKSQILIDALQSFGVEARVVQIVRGPTVTRYELQPARGVKVNRFTSLTNDIALALAATTVRIEAPIPGKSAIGIEIPNRSTDLVVLKDILSSAGFQKSSGLTLGLGMDLTGQATVTNLEKMPHLLVAGTTGSGKSVCINTLILSLLYRFTPRQLQMLMIDPKQVELSMYEGLPHLVGFSNQERGQIVVDPKKAALTLNQVVELMEQRYATFAALRVRNLAEFNARAPEPLPWVVVIIDELADLMMVASKSVETSICRLAQKARAAGIHVVVATQRPSTDVITGLIKVNIPSRIAFAVTSQVDSRVILDTGGAEQLLGKGDMLFLPVDASDPRRVQGAYVSNEEIQRVVEFWKGQSSPENLIELSISENAALESEDEAGGDEDDALMQQALEVVLRTQQASASMLQTELKVGYARARRILTLMEKKGWVGPAEGSKPRKILYTGG